jgi:hypothetical protein
MEKPGKIVETGKWAILWKTQRVGKQNLLKGGSTVEVTG